MLGKKQINKKGLRKSNVDKQALWNKRLYLRITYVDFKILTTKHLTI